MRQILINLAVIICFCFSSFTFTPAVLSASDNTDTSSGGGIEWHSYKEGMEMGKSKQKKIFINFYGDRCGFCKKMDKETFSDASVISYLNENFVSIRVNADKQRDLALAYRVSALPLTWFIAENGKMISSLPGFVPSERLLSVLKYISTDSYKEMKFNEFAKNM